MKQVCKLATLMLIGLCVSLFVYAQDTSSTEDNSVYVIVETAPEFPGGATAMMKYISDNLQYPELVKDAGIQGRAICQFVVEKDGSVGEIQVIRSTGEPLLDAEALRLISAMPKWTPGKQRGRAVRVKYTLPVNFKL